jgi:hypothetical protein
MSYNRQEFKANNCFTIADTIMTQNGLVLDIQTNNMKAKTEKCTITTESKKNKMGKLEKEKG